MGGKVSRRTRTATPRRGSPFTRTRKGYELNAVPDFPDIRDRPYEPALVQLKPVMPPPRVEILDQGTEGACTGFGLAAVINFLSRKRGDPTRVSPRMLYEMARRFDEWEGERYSGSSCRGAIRGWQQMGVCPEPSWPYVADEDAAVLTVERADAARSITVGAYYRVRPVVSDFHAALNEAEVLFASAAVHDGWDEPRGGVIPFRKPSRGGHAFAIVGYDERGFWVQNSWGTGWGKRGLAIWTYEDWIENIRDAWVVHLALPTPQIFGMTSSGRGGASASPQSRPTVPRRDIAGHFVHLDDGDFHDTEQYWSNADDVRVTGAHLAASKKYPHVLLYAHGGLNSPGDSARRIGAMKEVFKANGIYPFHFMYDTGLLEEIQDVLRGKRPETVERVGSAISALADKAIEWAARKPGRALWREMKRGAGLPFEAGRAGTQTLEALLPAILAPSGRAPRSLHLVGHSTGAILMGHVLDALAGLGEAVRVSSATLLAPACSVGFYRTHYEPCLSPAGGAPDVRSLTVCNLTDALEQDDNVASTYKKSLLYLVSRSFEEDPPERLLGMQVYSRTLERSHRRLRVHYSSGPGGSARTTSLTHGGFDNDLATMNALLETVLGGRPERPFTVEDLQY